MSAFRAEESSFKRIIRRYLLNELRCDNVPTVIWNSLRSIQLFEVLLSESTCKTVSIYCFCNTSGVMISASSMAMKYGISVKTYPFVLWPYRSNVTMMMRIGGGWFIDDYLLYYPESLGQFFPAMPSWELTPVLCQCEDGSAWYTGECSLAVLDCFFDEYLYWGPVASACGMRKQDSPVIIALGFLTKGVQNLEYLIQELVKSGYKYGITFPYEIYDASGIYVRYLLVATRQAMNKRILHEP